MFAHLGVSSKNCGELFGNTLDKNRLIIRTTERDREVLIVSRRKAGSTKLLHGKVFVLNGKFQIHYKGRDTPCHFDTLEHLLIYVFPEYEYLNTSGEWKEVTPSTFVQ